MRRWNTIKFCALLFTLFACDSTMSQWDSVRVHVEPAAALSLIDAGPDITTNKEFVRRAATQLSEALTYTWDKVSGPGNVLWGDASAQETSISVDQDGVYEIRVTARNEWGDETSDSFQLTWDTSGPSTPTGLKTLAGSLSGSDVRITNQTTIVLSWDEVSDTGVGLRDYTVTWYAGANCSGFETSASALTTNHHTITGQDGDTFSFKVMAIDQLDQSTASACSPSVTIDTSLPPALTAFTGTTGHVVGSVKLTLTLPADYSEYENIRIRRGAGATAPVDCGSGTLAKTFAKSELTASIVYTDLAPTAGDVYSYRACILDAAGNELGQNTTTNHGSKPHYVFASSTTMDGTFGGSGLATADAVCRSLVLSLTALSVVKEELHWKAIVSSSTESALSRIQILGKVHATDDPVFTLAAQNATDFWDGSHEALGFFANDEFGAAVGAEMIWSGTLSNGLPAPQNCNNWTTNAGGSSAVVGDPGFSNAAWIDNGSPEACNGSHRIYCINQRN